MRGGDAPGQIQALLGYFAGTALARVECLLGDYHASVAALRRVDLGGRSGPHHDIFAARMSVCYHAGVAYFGLRRYRDCARTLQGMFFAYARGVKTGYLKKLGGFEDLFRVNEQMHALLAVLMAVQPAVKVDDGLAKTVMEKYRGRLDLIEAGEETFEGLLSFALPKFVCPVVPDYQAAGRESLAAAAQKHHVGIFRDEVEEMAKLPKLRSYLKLYTSIEVSKLAGFHDMDEKDFASKLLAFKCKNQQLEHTRGGGSPDPLSGSVTTGLDVHFYVDDGMVHVDTAKKEQYFDKYFVNQIKHSLAVDDEIKQIPGNV